MVLIFQIKIKLSYQDNLDLNKNFIVIDDISFSYDETKPLLENINFSIPKILCIDYGAIWVWKKYLKSIIMGLIRPKHGNIFFENKKIY